MSISLRQLKDDKETTAIIYFIIMRKLSFLKSTISFVLLFTMSILLAGCSSGSDSDYVPSNANNFNVEDFVLTYTPQKIYGDYLVIDFNIKTLLKHLIRNMSKEISR